MALKKVELVEHLPKKWIWRYITKDGRVMYVGRVFRTKANALKFAKQKRFKSIGEVS